MIKVKGNTKKGQTLIAKGSQYEGMWLHQVYDKPSKAKQEAWNKCFDEYCNTEGATGLSIISHNTFGFSVSWLTPDGLRIETPKNSYLVIFPEYC